MYIYTREKSIREARDFMKQKQQTVSGRQVSNKLWGTNCKSKRTVKMENVRWKSDWDLQSEQALDICREKEQNWQV